MCKTFGNCKECFMRVKEIPNPKKGGPRTKEQVSVNTGVVQTGGENAATVEKEQIKEDHKQLPATAPKSGIHHRKRPKTAEIHVHVTTKTPPGVDFHNGRKGPSPTVTRASALLQMKVAEAPHLAMDMAWRGIGAAQRASHQRMLRLMQVSIAKHFDLIDLPVPLACIKVLVRARDALRWTPSTMAKHAATLSGAMNRLDQYMEGSEIPIMLTQFSVWSDFIKETKRQERLHKGRVPVAATWAEVKRVMDHLIQRKKLGTAVMLWVAWSHAARPGDVWKLKRSDITVTATRITILWTRGKVVTTRGPYTTFADPGPYKDLLEEYLNNIPQDTSLFQGVWRSQTFLREVRTFNRSLELKSLRRGALQCLSAAGFPESVLMLFSGHSTVDMLRRYLGFRPTEAVALMCENASLALMRCA